MLFWVCALESLNCDNGGNLFPSLQDYDLVDQKSQHYVNVSLPDQRHLEDLIYVETEILMKVYYER
jgi:hypothetical protein